MGSPLSPVLANIYIEYFEEMALGPTSLKLSMRLTYIDDTFILWPHQEDVQTLLDHVNSNQPYIQFTMEKEQDNKLPFLDVLVTHIQNLCSSYDTRMIFTSGSTLRRYLFQVKPLTKFNMIKNCVYSIPCSYGKIYKGETGRPLKEG